MMKDRTDHSDDTHNGRAPTDDGDEAKAVPAADDSEETRAAPEDLDDTEETKAKRRATERPVQELCEQERYDEACEHALDLYGNGIFAFLSTGTGEDSIADDAFRRFSFALRSSLVRFPWKASLRNWCFTLARRALSGAINRRAEQPIEDLCAQKRYDEAYEHAMDRYDKVIFAFLSARTGGDSIADDAAQEFRLSLRASLENFKWKTSLRNWCFKLAGRSVSKVTRKKAFERGERFSEDDIDAATAATLGHQGPRQDGHDAQIAPTVADALVRAREATKTYRKTAVKNLFAVVRHAHFDGENGRILTYRIDHEMSWLDVARQLLDAAEADDKDPRLIREASRVRMRYHRIRPKLQALAKQEGVLLSLGQYSEHRAKLAPVEQALIALRIDHALPWERLATKLGMTPDDAKTRFHELKDQLYEAYETEHRG